MSAARSALVGVDSSLGARLALEHAAQRAGPGGRLIVAHAISPQPSGVAAAVTQLEEMRRSAARELVDQLTADAAVETETAVVDGSPAERLAALAREHHVNELVVGSRGLGRFAASLGSVSHALLGEADRPVVVVPRSVADRPRQMRGHGSCVVVVGYDGSEPSRAALAYAAERASGGGLVVAVHAFEPTPDWLGRPNYQEALQAHQAQAARWWASFRRKASVPRWRPR